MEVGALEIGAGKKAVGRLHVVAGAGQDISLPLMVVNGIRPGPVLGLIGAIHGDEYEGTAAIWDLYRTLEPSTMGGGVVAVPIANLAAFQAGSRDNPLDGANLNRAFPGRAGGTISEQIAAVLMNQVVTQCDAVLDLHSGGRILDMLPLVLRGEGGDIAGRVDAITRATGLELDWQVAWRRTGMLAEAAVARGIPAVTIEIGSGGQLDEASLRLMTDAVRGVLGHLGIVPEAARTEGKQAQIRGDFIKATVGGFFRAAASLGSHVTAGQALGVILDDYGDVRMTVKSQATGLLAILRCTPYTQPGDQLAMVGETAAS